MLSKNEVIKKIGHIYKTLDKNKYPFIHTHLGSIGNIDEARKKVDYMEYLFNLANTEIKGKSILDAGFGPGLHSMVLAMMGAESIDGVDIFRDRIDEVQRLLDEQTDNLPIKYYCRDIMQSGFENDSFDCILSIAKPYHIILIPWGL